MFLQQTPCIDEAMKDALLKEIVQYVCIQAVHWGALSNDEGEGNENCKKAKQQYNWHLYHASLYTMWRKLYILLTLYIPSKAILLS